MKRLSKFFLSVLLLTVASVSWAACPEGQKQTYKGCETADEEVTEGTEQTYDEEVTEGTVQTYKGCEETDSNLCDYDYTRKGSNQIIVYEHSGVDVSDVKKVEAHLGQIQKFLGAGPASPTHVHMFHSKKSDLLAIGKKVCDIKNDDYSGCPRHWVKTTGQDTNASADAGGRAQPNCQIMLSEHWWSRNSKNSPEKRLSIIAHEYFHCHQFGLAVAFEAERQYGWAKSEYPDKRVGVSAGGPDWLKEGGAMYFGYNYAAKTDRQFIYKQRMQWALDDARASVKKGARLEKYISQEQSRTRGDDFNYSGGLWATAYLASLSSNKAVFINYYKDIAELERECRKRGKWNCGWEDSFKKNFGLTPKQFYEDFNKFMKKRITTQMKILMDPLKK